MHLDTVVSNCQLNVNMLTMLTQSALESISYLSPCTQNVKHLLSENRKSGQDDSLVETKVMRSLTIEVWVGTRTVSMKCQCNQSLY